MLARAATWFRFLDPRPFDPRCVDYTEPYAIELGNLQLLMFDSSAANDTNVDPKQVALYVPQFAEVARLARRRAFFVTHRPMWVIGNSGDQNGQEQLFTGNPTLQAASGTSCRRRSRWCWRATCISSKGWASTSRARRSW